MENVNRYGNVETFMAFPFCVRIIKTIAFSDLRKPIRPIKEGQKHKKRINRVDIKPFPNCLVNYCTKPFPLPEGSVERIIMNIF
jgi:hypothetical protein